MSQTIDSILVPTDGSEGARIGARRGIDIAATTDAEVHILSVVDTREINSNQTPDGPTEQEQLVEAETERAVDSIAELAQSYLSSRITTAVERGIPYKSINDYVETHDIDLIVMGTQGRTGVKRVLLGSVAEKTLRTATVPIFLVTPDADVIEVGEGAYKNILLPTDGSEDAEIAIEWGLTLAEIYDATIHTIYSVDTSRFGSTESMADIHDTLEQTGRDALETIRTRARKEGISVAGTIASGPAARTILSYSEEHDIDLIVMGTHGRSGVRRYLIGSVTETVVRNAAVPVCCIPMQ